MPENNGVSLSQAMLENVTDIDSFLLNFLIDFPINSEMRGR